jgi:hypothetical protein
MATAVSDSANVEVVELVAGRCHARSWARKYNNHWVICTGPRAYSISVQGTTRRDIRELWGNQVSMLWCTIRGGHKVGII